MNTLRYVLPSLLPLVLIASVSAQKTDGASQGASGHESATTATEKSPQKGQDGASKAKADESCHDSGAAVAKSAKVDATSPIAVFQKLNDADKKAVADAFARLDKNCPYGKRVSKTMIVLDKLYADAARNLSQVANDENVDPAMAKDLKAEIKAIQGLRAMNASTIKTTRKIMAGNRKSTGGGCCSSGAEGSAKAEKKAAPDLNAISQKLAASWATVNKDLKGLDPKVSSQLQADMKLIQSKGLDLGKLVLASLKTQGDKIGKVYAGLSCPETGLTKKHTAQIAEGSFTKSAFDASGKALASAGALLKVTNKALTAVKGPAKAEGSCCDSEDKTTEIGQ